MRDEYIMHQCLHWGEHVCITKVCEWKYAKQISNGENIPVQPLPYELNVYCAECSNTLFEELENYECPFCGSPSLSPSQNKIGWINSEDYTDRPIGYQCKKCLNVWQTVKPML